MTDLERARNRIHGHWVTEETAKYLLGYPQTAFLPHDPDDFGIVFVPCDGSCGQPIEEKE